MPRILTGIQSSGKPHLGNILGAILPAIELSVKGGNNSLFFIADLHSLTTIKDAEIRRKNTQAVAAAWLAFNFDYEQNILYRQSDIPEVCEFTWYLSCFAPYPMLANAHSFKDKSDKLSDVNAGLFTYPVLMAADIIMFGAEEVPVGKDQIQHIEIARDLAGAVNNKYGEILVVPKAKVDEQTMLIPGIDGQKMSKSYNNTIDIFLPEKELKKNIASIVTDATPLEEPKNPDTCTVFKLYSFVASQEQIAIMRTNYLNGGYGYGHAKAELLQIILEKFAEPRVKYNELISNPAEIERILAMGAEKARAIAKPYLSTLRNALGF